jgi:hypothetical protein
MITIVTVSLGRCDVRSFVGGLSTLVAVLALLVASVTGLALYNVYSLVDSIFPNALFVSLGCGVDGMITILVLSLVVLVAGFVAGHYVRDL